LYHGNGIIIKGTICFTGVVKLRVCFVLRFAILPVLKYATLNSAHLFSGALIMATGCPVWDAYIRLARDSGTHFLKFVNLINDIHTSTKFSAGGIYFNSWMEKREIIKSKRIYTYPPGSSMFSTSLLTRRPINAQAYFGNSG
jgi:hypothetical protein